MIEAAEKVTRCKSRIEIERALNVAFLGLNALSKNSRAKCIGGYFVVRNMITGEIVFELMIGRISNVQMARKYVRIAQEETQRIYQTKHISSWLTRNREEEKYGGGIHSVIYKIAMAFTGSCDEQSNEAISVCVANQLGLITANEIESITRISDNKITQELIRSINS